MPDENGLLPREGRLFWILILLWIYYHVAYSLHAPPIIHHFDDRSQILRLVDGSTRRMCLDKYSGYDCNTIEGFEDVGGYWRYSDDCFRYQDSGILIGCVEGKLDHKWLRKMYERTQTYDGRQG